MEVVDWHHFKKTNPIIKEKVFWLYVRPIANAIKSGIVPNKNQSLFNMILFLNLKGISLPIF